MRLAAENYDKGLEKQLSTGIEVQRGEYAAVFIDSSQNFGLCVPASTAEYEKVRNDFKSPSITLTRLKKNNFPEIRLTLRDASQLEIFSHFIDEILAFLSTTPDFPIAGIARRLSRWRRLFSVSSRAEFDQSIELGLLCELEVLYELIQRGYLVSAWTGPDMNEHDFKLPSESIECKATASNSGLSVEIHGSFQLIPPPGKQLTLVVRHYTTDPNGSISIPNLCHKILDELTADKDIFIEKLRLLNVELDQFDQASGHFKSYIPNSAFEFTVTEDFPHVPSIPRESRIHNLRYTLELSDPMSIPGAHTVNNFLE